MKGVSLKTARETAVDILCEIDKGAMSHEVLKARLDAGSLNSNDRDFVKVLVFGTLENLPYIDGRIQELAGRPASAQRPIVRNTLRISIYQFSYLKNIPSSAVCNEAVKIIEKRKLFGMKGFVNAVLRRCASETADAGDATAEQSLPEYILDILKSFLPEEDVGIVAKALLTKPPLCFRMNISLFAKEEIADCLRADAAKYLPHPIVTDSYYFTYAVNPAKLEAFNKGMIQIQGAASALACRILSPEKGSRVLDICAAPGGKTMALADMTGTGGRVIARDLTERKIKKIIENAARCGFETIITEVKDAAVFYPEDEEAFDYVMADLPCSGLGTISQKPEIRYRMNPEKIRELSALQKKILDSAVRYVKPGGYMVFSTCTFTPDENTENFEYIKNNLGLSPVDLTDKSQNHGLDLFVSWETAERHSEELKNGYIQILPGIDELTGGFFISLFRKEQHE